MRRWLVEETGEFRCPREGEWYRDDAYKYKSFYQSAWDHTTGRERILKVTELHYVDKIYIESKGRLWRILFDKATPLTDRFDEQNW